MRPQKKLTAVEFRKSRSLNTFIYSPDGHTHEDVRKWPAIIFLHGRNELGQEYEVLPDGGISNFVTLNSLPVFLIEPQCPADSEWVLELDTLAEFVKMLTAELNLDASRLYLTGLSMGGIGAWHLGISNPELFAAIVPVCGGTYPFLGYPEAVTRLKDVPVWAFHGMDDPILPVSMTKVLVDKLTEAKGMIRSTYYENTGHDAWTKTYTNIEVYEWLLSKRRTL